MGGMTESDQFPIQQISRRHKVWLGLNFLIRMVATGVLILVIYFFIPVEGAAGLVTTAALALIAMVIYTWAVIRMIGRISRAPNPMLVVGEAVVVAVLLFVALFALLYMVMTTSNPGAFSMVLDKSAALYFAMTITSTVGFGDIVPVSTLARNVVTFQMLVVSEPCMPDKSAGTTGEKKCRGGGRQPTVRPLPPTRHPPPAMTHAGIQI
jgi:hypothetical protein